MCEVFRPFIDYVHSCNGLLRSRPHKFPRFPERDADRGLETCPDDSQYHYRDKLRESFGQYGIRAASIDVAEEGGMWRRCSSSLTYDHNHYRPMQSDPEEIFRFLWENRTVLDVTDEVFTQVISVRPCMRMAPDGVPVQETIAEYLQVADLRADELQQPPRVRKAKGQVREALGYVWSSPILRSDVLLMGCLGFVALNFNVVLPVLAKVTFQGAASTYSWMASAMGVGALVSALVLATLDRPYGRRLIYANSILAVALMAAALMPTLLGVVAVMIVLGAGQVIGASSANALLQLDADPAVRGRCTALFSMTTSSATLFGGLLAGVITEEFGARWALAFGSIGTVVVVLAFAPVLFRDHADAPARRQASPIPAAT